MNTEDALNDAARKPRERPPPEKLSVSLEPMPPLDRLARMWRALEKIAEPSFFISWHWVRCWLETSGAEPKLLVVRAENTDEGPILGLALLHQATRRHHGRRIPTLYLQETGDPDFDSIYIEYNGILAATAHKDAVIRQSFRFLAEQAQIEGDKQTWQDVRLSGIDASTKDAVEAGADHVYLEGERRSFFVDLKSIRSSGKTYLDILSANTRQRINRARRLNERYGELEIRRAADLDEALEFFDRLKELHQIYWHTRGEPGAFTRQYFEIFHKNLLRTAFENNVLDLLRVKAGEDEVGYLLNFVLNGTVYQYQSGFSYAQPKLLPGYVTQAMAIQYYLDRGLAAYNFLAGENQQKISLCTDSEPLYWLTLRGAQPSYLFEKFASLGLGRLIFGNEQAQSSRPVPPAPRVGETPRKVLVMGDDVRSFLGTVRSLGRQGIIVDACPFDFDSPALRSRYLRRSHRLPSYAIDRDAWIGAMQRILQSESYDLVIPCDDRNIIPLMLHRSEFDSQNIALPNAKAFEFFYDKHKTRQLAQDANVPIAPGRLLNRDDTASSLQSEFGFPLAIKPRRSYLLDSPAQRQGVLIFDDLKQLESCLRSIEQHDAFFIEGFFHGYGVGVSILAHDGRILQAFEHHRVQEPMSGGGSTYRVSHALSRGMIECVRRLVSKSDYTGVGMFEFRLNPTTGEFILLEVNARLWGSLPLPIAAGVDFPYLLYRLLVDNHEEAMRMYKIGLYGRNVTADFYCTVENYSRIKEKSLGAALYYLGGTVIQWLRVLTPHEKHDSFAPDDPRPGLREYRDLFVRFRGAIWERMTFSGGGHSKK